jgi:hypothetical protein
MCKRAGLRHSWPSLMRYFTDGIHLYEIAARRTVQNFGLTRGTISYVIIRDCVTEVTATIDDLHLAALSEVR